MIGEDSDKEDDDDSGEDEGKKDLCFLVENLINEL
tara:strand:+ start:770 stop:874 length:105 start_codon:yes stop_codon:yes gene_type:complete